MLKNRSRYSEKIKELKAAVKDKLKGMVNTVSRINH